MFRHPIFARMQCPARERAADMAPNLLRNVEDGPIVLDCPLCKKLVIPTNRHIEERTGTSRKPVWIRAAIAK